MTNQVTSIEQSKRLLELGVPAEKANMVWCPMYRFDVEAKQFIHIGEYDLCMKHKAYTVIKEDIIPAFTVADLLYVLPKILYDNYGNALPLNVTTSTGSYWCLFWGNWGTHKGWEDSASLVDLLTTAVEWVVSNGYKLNV